MSDPTFHRLAILQGSRDAILSVAFSPDGKFVAAVGYSGVTVWDLATNNAVPIPQVPFKPLIAKYVFSALSWLCFETNRRLVLLIGSFRGDILAWDWSSEYQEFKRLDQIPPQTQGMEILAIDVYQTQVPAGRRGRVVVAAADRSVRVFALSAAGEWDTVFSITLEEGFLPKVVRFCKNTRVIFAFSRTGGGVIQLDRTTGTVLWHKTYGPDIMASVCLHPDVDFFVACTGRDFQMFKINTLELVRTFEGDNPIVRYSKHAVFIEDGRLLVGGTDRGCALVYETDSGKVVQTLEYPRGGLVQYVAALTINDRELVAIAGSTLQQSADVVVFQKQYSKQILSASSDKTRAADSGPPQNLDNNVASPSPHGNSILVGFRIQRISICTFFQNLIILTLMLCGMYHLGQEHMAHLIQLGRRAFIDEAEEVERVAVIAEL